MSNQVQEFYTQALLANIAYGYNFVVGSLGLGSNQNVLLGDKVTMPKAQAATLSSFEVVKQFESSNGASMTLFKQDGKYSLAVRGTEPNAADFTADFLLAMGVPSQLNPEFKSLQDELKIWISTPGILKDIKFTVTGHSLGGYLASALKSAVDGEGNALFDITDAYLFNSPGFGGVFGDLLDSYQKVFGFKPAGTDGIWNIQAQQGLSVTSGLGAQLSQPIFIWNENGSNGIQNHSIKNLTAALAVQSVVSNLFESISVAELNRLSDVSGLNTGTTPDSLLDALRRVLLPSVMATDKENFEAFYKNLVDLSASPEYLAIKGRAQLEYLGDKPANVIVSLAQQDTAIGQAVRHSLTVEAPFALVGTGTASEAYAKHPTEYWQARADMLERLDYFALAEKAAYAPEWRDYTNPNNHVFDNEPAAWFDLQTGINVQRGNLFPNFSLTYFANATRDTTLEGRGMADMLFGMGGNDTLKGGDGRDTLVGGAGNDYLYGGKGADTYIYVAGDGNDRVYPGSDAPADGAIDSLIMRNIRFDDVRISHAQNDLYIEYAGEQVLISGWYTNPLNSDCQLKEIVFADGIVKRTAELTKLGLSMYGSESGNTMYLTPNWDNVVYAAGGADTVYGNTGNDTIYGGDGIDMLQGWSGNDFLFGGQGNDTLKGERDSDTLEGGIGNDSLYGGSGADTYVYRIGDGSDRIDAGTDSAAEGSIDRLILNGIQFSDVRISHSQSNLLLDYAGERITIINWFTTNANGSDFRLKEIEFADGLIKTTPEITKSGLALYGSESGESLYATPGWDNIIYAGRSNDTVYGNTGNDTIYGNDGVDTLQGWSGNDVIFGGQGNDTLKGERDNDTLEGGVGNDSLYGGFGVDTYVYRIGDGSDRIDAGTDSAAEGSIDRLILNGIQFSDVRISHSQNNLFLDYAGERITIVNWFTTNSNGADFRLKEIEFANNFILSTTEITKLGLAIYGTESADTIYGTPGWDNIMLGLGGNDNLIGSTGNDVLHGGSGSNILNGDAGNDTYFFDNSQFTRVIDASGYDSFNFGNLQLSDFQFKQVSGSLSILLANTIVSQIDAQFLSSGPVVEDFVFSDQHYTWDAIQLIISPPTPLYG